jgi:hypothetical protein
VAEIDDHEGLREVLGKHTRFGVGNGEPLHIPNPKWDRAVESHPFGYAQGRLWRKVRARMGLPGLAFVLVT